ncbi:MAG: ATP-dependent metallopeptidase FtsH/Yme1/Tma family protein, partial [Treponema sp.]|nr:ATP-dependent metallopeptidase FtsH/Yme1/Tma family protein [Treponema sp.]
MFEPNDNMPNRGPSQPKGPSGFTLIFSILILGLLLFYLFRGDGSTVVKVTYSEFMRFVEQNQIESVTINKNDTIDFSIRGSTSGAMYRTDIPYNDQNLLPSLKERNVNVSGAPDKITPARILMPLLPWIFALIIIFIVLRNMQGAGMRGFNFGKSKAKRYHDEGKKVSFSDVAGQKDAKFELEEVV